MNELLPQRSAETTHTSPQPSKEENTWAMILHLSVFSFYCFPIPGLVAPLTIWLIKRNESAYLDAHGKILLNWMLSMVIYFVACIILCLILIGFVLLLAWFVIIIVFPIIAAIKASNGETWPYPMSFRFIS